MLLLAAMLMSIANVGHAYDVVIDGIYYNLNELNGTASVTNNALKASYAKDCYEGVVRIPSSFEYEDKEYTVTSIGTYAFTKCSLLTTVKIPETVTEIEDYAFYDSDQLCSISQLCKEGETKA